uniref:Sirohydrochlorin cobaltochelatase n=1 Tax=Candidatus Kentrum sp. FW TaxID=2126338 RepID=A0A450TRT1_9GAMM|nr:MAG: sirohydrochlorin cobaltochelatase [Candidatus Kentron sp. FW]
MKDTILLVGHGSRGPGGNRETEEFAEQWRARRPDLDIRLCHIEFADVLLDDGLDQAAGDAAPHGTGRVIVAPLIINAAGHVKTEIPEGIAKARGRHPNVEFIYVPHLGACDPILAILKRRLGKIMRGLDMPDPVTTGVILLGRGSSDRMANGDVARMARWLFEASEHELVDIAFTGITHPRLERVVQRQVRLGAMQIIILPYYLFTGRLMERIKNQTANLERQYPGIRFARAEHFGFEEEIFQLLDERVRDAGKPEAWMPCDGCKLVDS